MYEPGERQAAIVSCAFGHGGLRDEKAMAFVAPVAV
jgi:hypothetical protein